ncbi:MAG: hypothetical protein GF409_03065 [Candidatus Omnitrophica bacterium]|nr:hypothetical protein [Candidatus Omnitrophota bacterium]
MEKRTKQRLYLYAVLLVAVLLQVRYTGTLIWFPDLILLVVVYTGIFWGAREAFSIGLFAGLVRGCFSPYTFGLDLVLFPVIGALVSGLARMFYRQNPATQLLTAAVAALSVILAHTFYLNAVTANPIRIRHVIHGSQWALISTIFLAPLLFILLQAWLGLEE